ncbi:2-C-methyl-D-erythritol 2,4-cyclodiphosphate synthase [Alicyclobacillus sp. SO9]|uniref:2-C-methyl-D-erythritol 2,4-cyclodiphosphate synthase n=1 Tax=Alicyclobacillus sp. SO9 TaxID=2665646 RepID=UPI0018E809C6|nr:2-C-methyl-D-erythritol 2,4-cyclodiphosphate synthase [Alicyclobacillus sp. SO9]QQE81466.1 2-C-methyl-D-erythritol 2,4-cyclodiphosphate synthase [Alicyclobacillus sp. SO9]
MRIGFGYDVHQMVAGRPLILGGVKIPYELGLEGHSDADVILHAAMDAVLGALALGDIGQHFPNTDPEFRDADSKELFRHVWRLIESKNYQLGNIDIMVLCEEPKLSPYIETMREQISVLTKSSKEQVSVKATTMERMGFVGRKEGIAAQAVVLLVNQQS